MTCRVKLSLKEIAEIRSAYPAQSSILDGLLNPQGKRYYNILLDEATVRTIRHEFGAELSDALYAKAYTLSEGRFFSYYLQLREILSLPKSQVSCILEIGPGINILKGMLELHGYKVSTMDVNLEHAPTFHGDLLQYQEHIGKYDVVCAFQVLEHLPSKEFRHALINMRRYSRRYVFISLPCPTNNIYLHLRGEIVQRLLRRLSCDIKFYLPLPFRPADRDEQSYLRRQDKHNPHYWEVNRRSYPKRKVLKDIEECGIKVKKHFHNQLYPYHWFVLGVIS